MDSRVVIRQDVYISIFFLVLLLGGSFTGGLDRTSRESVEFLSEELIVISHSPVNLLFQLVHRQGRILPVGAWGPGQKWYALGFHILSAAIG